MTSTMDLDSQLCQFIGTEVYHYNALYPWLTYTDGVKFFAQNAGNGAYWFLDIIGTELASKVRRNPFMVVNMTVNDGVANIVVTDGNDKLIWKRSSIHTDCPVGIWKFFLSSNVLMLPSEY